MDPVTWSSSIGSVVYTSRYFKAYHDHFLELLWFQFRFYLSYDTEHSDGYGCIVRINMGHTMMENWGKGVVEFNDIF